MLGEFLELSLPAPDIRASLAFWLRLGFSEVPVGDVRGYHYAAVTDGRIVIGLHGDRLEQPALSFVQPDLAEHFRHLVASGVPPVFERFGDEQFHEAGVQAPDGVLLVLVEARTLQGGEPETVPAPLIGRSSEISLCCAAPAAALRFWTAAGFVAASGEDEAAVTLARPDLTLGLRSRLLSRWPGLRFEVASTDSMRAALADADILTGPDPEGLGFTSPEGLCLVLATDPG